MIRRTGMKGTLALWVMPDSRLRLLWRPASIAVGGPGTADAAGTAGVNSFMEDLVRVPGVSSLSGLPEPCGAGCAAHCHERQPGTHSQKDATAARQPSGIQLICASACVPT